MTTEQFTTRSDEFVSSTGLPLRKFRGILQNIIPNFGQENNKVVEMPFTDVEVIETEPGVVWPHPIAQIECRAFFTRAGQMAGFGAWYEMCNSSTLLGYPDIMSLKGLELTMDSSMRIYEAKEDCTGPADNLGVEDGMCLACGKEMDEVKPHRQQRQFKEWKVAEVGGSNSTGDVTEEDLLAILDKPKNTSEFSQAILANPGLRATYAGPDLYDGNLLAGLVARGKVKLEGDQYSRVIDDGLPF